MGNFEQNTKVSHSHQLPENIDGPHTVVHVKSGSKKRLAVASFTMLFLAIIGFGGFAAWQQNTSRASSENTLNEQSTAAEETGLNEAQSTSLFNLKYENISFLPASGDGVTETTPYPVSGADYRVVRTSTPTDDASWVAVTTPTTMEFIDNAWTLISSDNPETINESRLPSDAKPGDTFYYRAEILNTKGVWEKVNDDVITFKVPTALLDIQDNGDGTAVLTIDWNGTADGEADNLYVDKCSSCVLVSADNPEMTNGMTVPLTAESEFFTRSGNSANFSHEAGSTTYYAIYNYLGVQFSEPVKAASTPADEE